MIAARKKKALPSFPSAKIARIVGEILPKGKDFKVRTADSGIRKMKVVRIVTPAWKNLRPPERISKVLAAMDGKLSEVERERILRFSVLTPEEYADVMKDSPVVGRSSTTAKRLTVKRKTKRALVK
jgi:hypothetical protein